MRFQPNQPRLSPDRAYVERERGNGSMQGVMLMRRTCVSCKRSKVIRGGTMVNRKFRCAECK